MRGGGRFYSRLSRFQEGAAAGLLAAIALHAAGDFEAAPTFKASEILPPAALKGPHHSIDEKVTLQGLHHQYRITSDYGVFDAAGDEMLTIRLKEVDALARLAETSQAEVALTGVGGALGGANGFRVASLGRRLRIGAAGEKC